MRPGVIFWRRLATEIERTVVRAPPAIDTLVRWPTNPTHRLVARYAGAPARRRLAVALEDGASLAGNESMASIVI